MPDIEADDDRGGRNRSPDEALDTPTYDRRKDL